MSRCDNYVDNFNNICELFCHLTNELEKGGCKDIASIIDDLMFLWLDRTLIK